ncbi:unnamed protein product [Cylindrotheca closterium]|uniref:FYVE-type domain-containing protein n=1 Tax=Cylindrotheca closterium TaxID=2856 RepID=A0AAD2FR60_9STRA|nr:unnamed protein product [Cylindrotheca closterium]
MTSAKGTSIDIANYFESICYANAVKEQKNEKIGLVVKRSNAWNTLYISGIKDTSKFANSKLQIGMVILTINGMKSPTTVKEIQKVMKETVGDLTIMAASISKEITIAGSNANSPARSPVHSPVRPSKVVASAQGSPQMNPLSPKEFPLSFRTESRVPGKDDTATTNLVPPEFPLDNNDNDTANNKNNNNNDKIENKSSHDTATADTFNASSSYEMTLSDHQQPHQEKSPTPVSPPDSPARSSYSQESSASPRSSPGGPSPGSSPMSHGHERKVSESGQRDSPVSICSIDHTGNIVITPKGSPKDTMKEDVQMPKLSSLPTTRATTAARSTNNNKNTEEEKKEEPSIASDDSYDDLTDSSQELETAQQEEKEAEEKAKEQKAKETTSRQSATAAVEEKPPVAHAKPPPSPVRAAAAKQPSKKQQQQQQEDRAAKRRSRAGPRMAPGVAPGAYHVAASSVRPSSSKAIRSLSPAPRPGAHRVPGVNSRASAPAIAPITSAAAVASAASSNISSHSARAERTIGNDAPLSPAPRIRSENMPPPHPDLPQPGARRMAGPNARTASGDSYRSPNSPMSALPSKQGYVPASASSPAGASAYSGGGPMDIDDLNDQDVGMGVPVHENPSLASSPQNSKDSSSIDDDQADYYDGSSVQVSEAPEMSVITSDDLVIAAEVQEHPDILEDRIRKQILQETAQAAVVVMEHGGNNASNRSFQEEELEEHKHKNVKEKLFGGGGKGRNVSQELSVAPDQYIRKRDFLPWNVQQNMTTNMWIASVVTDQKAYDEGNTTEQDRSKAVFSAKTEREARETGLAMATPYLQPFKTNPICVMCSSKFAVFNRPHNCRNCGVVVCSKCTVIWSSKRFPSTYQTSKSTHSVCLACDWSANNFQDAVLQGNLTKATKLYESGNVNLRTPYISSKKKSGQEIMYPVHMAILGRNVELVRWLCKERCAPVTTEVKSKGNLKSLPIGTSKARTPLKLAVKQKDHDMLKFLVAELNVSLFDEDIKADYRWILAHLSNTLHRAPYEYEIAKNKKNANSSSHSSSPRSHHSFDARAYAGSGSATVATNASQGSSRGGSKAGESRADSLAEV